VLSACSMMGNRDRMALPGRVQWALLFLPVWRDFAGTLTLLPVIWAEYYGRKNFGVIRGVTLPVQVLAQASGALIAGFLRDWTHDYNTSLSLFTIFAIIAAGLVFFARPFDW
jgi:hypothetical protein